MKTPSFVIGLIALAIVKGDVGFGPGEQKWGYVDVREGAHMFWWLFYTTAEVSSYTDRSLIIWLQGGPGASSTGFGNFGELGPLDAYLEPRYYTWVKDANVLFIDNPVGTGFSYVDDSSKLATTNKQIADDLVVLITEFMKQNPEFEQVPLYIACESYGGKMTIEFALELQKAIDQGTVKAALMAVELGDSWISPIDSVLTWAPYLLNIGAVDQAGYENVQTAARATAAAVQGERWVEATSLWGRTEGVIMEETYDIDFYNILTPITNTRRVPRKVIPILKDEIDDRIEVIMNDVVREALNLNHTWGSQSNAVFQELAEDFMKPVVDVVAEVLNNTNIVVNVVTGQLDLIVDTPGTVNWVDKMQWWGSDNWKRASRTPIVSRKGVLEGYVKYAENLRFYWVNRAGHMVPSDNPDGMEVILRQMTADYSAKVTKKKFH